MHRASSRIDSRAGLTLLELILVMFIIATVLGGGIGLFVQLDLEKVQAAGVVKSVLRSAQNTASASQAPTRVRVDRETGTLQAETLMVVGTWHFEDRELRGSGGVLGVADSPDLFTHDGYIGDAMSFADRRGVASIPVDLDPAFDLADGFVIDCVIRHEDVGGGRLLTIADHVKLELGPGGKLRGSFRARIEKLGELDRPGGVVAVESRPGVIAPDRWTRLRLSYDRTELVLFVDNVRVAAASESARVWKIDGDLVLSDPRLPFPGSVDNLVIHAVLPDEPQEVGSTVRILQSPDTVRFAPGGGLDRRFHRVPPEIVLGFEDGSSEVVGVGIYGTVE